MLHAWTLSSIQEIKDCVEYKRTEKNQNWTISQGLYKCTSLKHLIDLALEEKKAYYVVRRFPVKKKSAGKQLRQRWPISCLQWFRSPFKVASARLDPPHRSYRKESGARTSPTADEWGSFNSAERMSQFQPQLDLDDTCDRALSLYCKMLLKKKNVFIIDELIWHVNHLFIFCKYMFF